MADASTVIASLAQQVAQLVVDKTILTAELEELRAQYAQTVDLEIVDGPPAGPVEE